MSALIHHFVVHRLIVNQEEKIQAVPREKCLAVTPQIEHLAHQINHSFNSKPGKGVGHFVTTAPADEDSDTGPKDVSAFASQLGEFMQAHQQGADDLEPRFHQFSVNATERLIQSLVNTGSVETGFLIFCQYEHLATQYLMIALLNTRAHVEVDKALELYEREHLDLAKMQLAVRIDLTQYSVQPERERYISFIKGRMGRKVSDFFMDFIGCEELVDNKQQNKQLIASVDSYLSGENLNREEQAQHRDELKSYFKEKIDSGETVSVQELSSRLPADEQANRSFEQYAQSMEAPLEQAIQPDPAALRQLSKFSGSGAGVSISFDRKHLGERVVYDPATDTLTIHGVPPNLKDQLTRQSG